MEWNDDPPLSEFQRGDMTVLPLDTFVAELIAWRSEFGDGPVGPVIDDATTLTFGGQAIMDLDIQLHGLSTPAEIGPSQDVLAHYRSRLDTLIAAIRIAGWSRRKDGQAGDLVFVSRNRATRMIDACASQRLLGVRIRHWSSP